MQWLALLGGILTTVAQLATASDQQRERDYASSLEQTISIGRVVWLKAGEQSFLSLFTEAEKSDNSHAVIILHDSGEHPDQQPLIHDLRSVLPQHNWATLSVQLPIRESGASEADYYPLFDEARLRLDAALEYLRNNGARQIALVGYGMGAAMATYQLSSKPDNLTGLVTISLPLPESSQPQAQIGHFIKNIALPMLDIYAEFDLPAVADSARQRRMISKDNPVYRQIRIDGENHAYQHDPGLVVKRVYSWLTLTANAE